ncbi:hypothetical protein BN903_69 [Halorubrum sp. AJ67]|nr:hypothetical protein BN903_69 [Halorubrum sp. AJ67]
MRVLRNKIAGFPLPVDPRLVRIGVRRPGSAHLEARALGRTEPPPVRESDETVGLAAKLHVPTVGLDDLADDV